MLKAKGLPAAFWGEAVTTAVFILNRSPTTSLKGVTPYEAWHGKKPDVSFLRTFGCVGHCNDPNFRERKPNSLHLRDSPRKRLSRAIPVSSSTNPYNTGIKEELHNIIITTSEYNSSAQAGYKSDRTESRKVKHLRSGST
jgi:hypothetical protein